MIEDKDYGMGKCWAPGCGKWAIVGLNGPGLCPDHLNEAFKKTGLTITGFKKLEQDTQL